MQFLTIIPGKFCILSSLAALPESPKRSYKILPDTENSGLCCACILPGYNSGVVAAAQDF